MINVKLSVLRSDWLIKIIIQRRKDFFTRLKYFLQNRERFVRRGNPHLKLIGHSITSDEKSYFSHLY